jgi:hypothetical protein
MFSDTPDTSNTVQWLTVTQAAAALGVSARAIQKRAARGSLTARKVERNGVEVWEVDGRELRTNRREQGREPANLLRQTFAPQAPFHAQGGREPGANMDANPFAPMDAPRELLEHLKAENNFLRGVVEQLQRDGAETRAALRKALENGARALPAPAGNASTQMPIDADVPAQNGGAAKEKVGTANAPQNGAERAKPSALTYADILAELEASSR